MFWGGAQNCVLKEGVEHRTIRICKRGQYWLELSTLPELWYKARTVYHMMPALVICPCLSMPLIQDAYSSALPLPLNATDTGCIQQCSAPAPQCH